MEKTDPRIDANNVTNINQKHKGNVLNVIRLSKYWNRYNSTYTIPSYLLETIILNYYEELTKKDNYWVDLEFKSIVKYISENILYDIEDPKGIQGNINYLTKEERNKVSERAQTTYYKASEASRLELEEKNQKSAINKWREIFGDSFPKYEE